MQGINRLFLDVILGAFGLFLVLLVITLIWINDPTDPANETKIPGSLAIELFWPDKIPVDIDMWVRAPEATPVGYSRKSGTIFNLLRDDLGTLGDIAPANVEHVFSRGITPGDYVVNAHFYKDNRADKGPILLTLIVTLKHDGSNPIKVHTNKIPIDRQNIEMTLVRFTIKKDGSFDYDSINRVPIKIRSQKKDVT